MGEKKIGEIGHYFSKVGVAAVKLKEPLKKGDDIHVKGHTTDFVCTVNSMQIDRKDIDTAKAGDDIGFIVPEKVREHDAVYKVTA